MTGLSAKLGDGSPLVSMLHAPKHLQLRYKCVSMSASAIVHVSVSVSATCTFT